ncbi:MAG: hypothetical protein CMP22_07900 [Rickettsiales bacterium]|nr:hypothetical protein [Rickettsiales bacterium]
MSHFPNDRQLKVTISTILDFGHIFSTLIIIVFLVTWGINVENRLTYLETQSIATEKRMDREIQYIRDSLGRIELKIDQKNQ